MILKAKLTRHLGTFGTIIYYVLSLILSAAPFIFLPIQFWLVAILILVINLVPYIGELLRLALYIWSFVIVVALPIDIFAIIFYISFAIYFFAYILPIIFAIFVSLPARNINEGD